MDTARVKWGTVVLVRLCVYGALRIDTVTAIPSAVGEKSQGTARGGKGYADNALVCAKSFDSEAGTCLCLTPVTRANRGPTSSINTTSPTLKCAMPPRLSGKRMCFVTVHKPASIDSI